MAIGEFSERSGLSAKRLRTYAAQGLLGPTAVDPGSGYRYYSAGQLADAQVIDALRKAGVPLTEIRSFMRQPSPEHLDTWARRLQDRCGPPPGRPRPCPPSARGARGPNVPDHQPRFPGEAHDHTSNRGRTDIGQLRENNEDAIVTSDRLALVADGMGGHPGGEIAANAAAGVVSAVFTGRSIDELEAAVRAANWAIRDRAMAQPGLDGMGTTICAAGLLTDGHIGIVNVGDSRAYLWRDGVLTQLTQDHSVTAELIERGDLRGEDASRHPHYGVLTRALGVGPDVDIDRRTLPVEDGDRIVVCTDGLFNELSGEEITSAMVGGGDMTAIVDNLIEKAITHGGRDNVSVVVAEVAA